MVPSETQFVTREISVECYSGYTLAERPVAFVLEGRRFQVTDLLKRWHSPDGLGFRVVTADGNRWDLTYHQAQDQWTLHLSPDYAQNRKEQNVET
jgi:hypothetical protein